MPKDDRNPETLGKTLIQLKKLYPDKSAAERADMLHEFTVTYTISTNGK